MVRISVIIPALNDEKTIKKCLETLKGQTFGDFEVIVADGHSKDRTVEVARQYGATVVYENTGTVGGARGAAVKAANGRIIASTDADAYFPKGWLAKIAAEFDGDPDLVALGGEDVVDDGKGYFETAVFQIDLARIGNRADPKKRIRGCNAAYRKDAVLGVGGFNEALVALEEADLNSRLAEKGYKMKFNPDITVYHRRRSSFGGLFRQMFRNGVGSISAIRANPKMLNPKHLLPFLAVPALLAWASLLNAASVYIVTAAGAYAILMIAQATLILAKTGKWQYLPILPAILAVREIAFGLGLHYGVLIRGKPAKKM